jgi:hypothetical protein
MDRSSERQRYANLVGTLPKLSNIFIDYLEGKKRTTENLDETGSHGMTSLDLIVKRWLTTVRLYTTDLYIHAFSDFLEGAQKEWRESREIKAISRDYLLIDID